jgi:DNA-binding IclR family transcriptional regulator
MGTVVKALSLLDHFSHHRTEIGLSDMARLSGANKATVFRYLSELQAAGLVEQTPSGRHYRLGPEILRLAALREAAVPMLAVARDMLVRLSTATGETAHFSMLRGDTLHTLAHEYSPRHATRVMMDDAETLSFHATASGLAVLAFAPPDLLDRVLTPPLHAFTDATETDPAAIRDGLDAVRRRGFAEGIGGFEADVHSHAAAIFGPDGSPLGALAVAAPKGRMTDEHRHLIRGELAACAAALTQKTGGFAPLPHAEKELIA